MNLNESNRAVVHQWIDALEHQHYDKANNYLTENFTCHGWTPKPLDKAAFIRVISGLKEGIPDLAFHLHDDYEDGQTVQAKLHVTGHQSSTFILPDLATPPIPETQRKINLETVQASFQMHNQQITELRIEGSADRGIRGLFHQLGFDLPIIQ